MLIWIDPDLTKHFSNWNDIQKSKQYHWAKLGNDVNKLNAQSLNTFKRCKRHVFGEHIALKRDLSAIRLWKGFAQDLFSTFPRVVAFD